MKPFADLEPKEYDVLLNALCQPVILKIGLKKDLYQDGKHSSVFVSGSPQENDNTLQNLDKEAFYFCYSANGKLGEEVCGKLATMGMNRPTNLRGGVERLGENF